MATVQAQLKETLVGTTREPELSTQIKAVFDRNAREDAGSDEPHMTESDFVNAIAPENENYVSFLTFSTPSIFVVLEMFCEPFIPCANGYSKSSTRSSARSMQFSSKLQIGARLGE